MDEAYEEALPVYAYRDDVGDLTGAVIVEDDVPVSFFSSAMARYWMDSGSFSFSGTRPGGWWRTS